MATEKELRETIKKEGGGTWMELLRDRFGLQTRFSAALATPSKRLAKHILQTATALTE